MRGGRKRSERRARLGRARGRGDRHDHRADRKRGRASVDVERDHRLVRGVLDPVDPDDRVRAEQVGAGTVTRAVESAEVELARSAREVDVRPPLPHLGVEHAARSGGAHRVGAPRQHREVPTTRRIHAERPDRRGGDARTVLDEQRVRSRRRSGAGSGLTGVPRRADAAARAAVGGVDARVAAGSSAERDAGIAGQRRRAAGSGLAGVARRADPTAHAAVRGVDAGVPAGVAAGGLTRRAHQAAGTGDAALAGGAGGAARAAVGDVALQVAARGAADALGSVADGAGVDGRGCPRVRRGGAGVVRRVVDHPAVDLRRPRVLLLLHAAAVGRLRLVGGAHARVAADEEKRSDDGNDRGEELVHGAKPPSERDL